MPDNTKITGPQDPNTINLGQKHEIAYWTQALGVSEAMLRAAVAAVGNKVADVRRRLKGPFF